MNSKPHPDRATCEEAFRRLDDYLDRELSPGERARVEEHLEFCEMCASEYRFEASFLVQVRAKIGRLQTPPDVRGRLLGRLAELVASSAPQPLPNQE